MKKFLTISLFATMAFSCSHQQQPREDFVRSYFQKYPEATLLDIYKGCFQDVFGPAHLLTDREAVTKYIQYEMENAESFEPEDYTPCGWQANFYQVNLKIIKDGRVPMDVFVDAFMASANGIDTTLTQTFVEDWHKIQQTIRKTSPELEGFADDSAFLAKILNEGKYVVHHSQKFNEHYHPHYRIIRRDIFEKKILPLLK
jgi:hypothetical protein